MTSTTESSPFLEGPQAPVQEEVSVADLPVTGTLPPELDGRYLRNGSNPDGPVPDVAEYHAFLGPGMVHGVRLRDGRAEWYRNRFVRGGNTTPAAPSDCWLLDSPNTNVVAHGGRVLALMEGGGLPVEISPEMDRMATWDAEGALAGGFTAHPKIDPESGELHAINFSTTSTSLGYVVLDQAGKLTHRADIPVEGQPLVHDIGLTATRVVLLDLPVTLSQEVLATAGAAAPMTVGRWLYRWDQEHAPRIGLLPRYGTAEDVRWIEAPQCSVFHVLNAYDGPGEQVVLDVVRYDRAFHEEPRVPFECPPVLARWTVDPVLATVSEQRVSDRTLEFPRVDPRRVARQHRYGWFVGFGPTGGMLKVDMHSGEIDTYDHGPGRMAGEPAFVPRPGGTGEDDGWIMSVVHDLTTNRGELVVIDAADLSAPPVARVHLPRRVPTGFHGNWVDDADLTGS